jgi:hypothetical protein
MVKDRVVTENDIWRLRVSWGLLALSVLFGVIELLMAVRVASPVQEDGSDNPEPSPYDAGLRLWSGLQLGCFVFGLFVFAYFGMELIDNPVKPSPPQGLPTGTS